MRSNQIGSNGNCNSQLDMQRAQLQIPARKRGGARRMAGAMAGVAIAGALLLAAPQTAHAQVQFGVQVGGYSGYVAPAYGYGYSDPYAVQQWQQRRAYEEHEQWEAARAAEWQREHWGHDRWDRRDNFRDEDRGGGHPDHERGW